MSDREELLSSITISFYKNSVSAKINKGFQHLNNHRLTRGIRAVNKAYHMERVKRVRGSRPKEIAVETQKEMSDG